MINAKNAIFTVGRNNMHKHPHGEVLERYTGNIFRTDLDGHVKISLDKTSMEIVSYGDYLYTSPVEIIYIFIYSLLLSYYFYMDNIKGKNMLL